MDIPTPKLFMENQTTNKYMDIQVKTSIASKLYSTQVYPNPNLDMARKLYNFIRKSKLFQVMNVLQQGYT